MGRAYILLLFVTILCVSCADKQMEADFQPLSGNSFVLEVNRVSENPVVQFPSDVLEEKDFQEITTGAVYHITFSEDLKDVSIVTASMLVAVKGTISEDTKTYKQYELNEVSDAGGRLIIWTADDTAFEAEYTRYGSGVPILRSERGFLNPLK